MIATTISNVFCIVANLWLLFLSLKWMRRYQKLADEHFELQMKMFESDLWWERNRPGMMKPKS